MLRTVPVLLALVLPVEGQDWVAAPRVIEDAGDGEFGGRGDFDGDGHEDLIWFEGHGGGQPNFDRFAVFYNDGAGDFARAPVPETSLPVAPGYRPAGFDRFEDMTGDGLPDVVVHGNQLFLGFEELRVYPALAGGGFGAAHVLPLDDRLHSSVLADLEGDGTFEIATLSTKTSSTAELRWWSWNGSGFTAGPSALVVGGYFIGYHMDAVDLNADQIPDLVLGANNSTQLLRFHTVNGTPTAVSSMALPYEGSFPKHYPYVGDMDGDGDDDLLVIDRHGFVHRYVVVVQENPGVFVPGSLHTIGLPSGFTMDHASYRLVDWDSDGDLDLSAFHSDVTPELTLHENDGANQFDVTHEVSVQMGVDNGAPGVPLGGHADFNGDGHMDFAARNHTYAGDGLFRATLEPVPQVPFMLLTGVAMTAVDVECDGDVDFLSSAGACYVNDGTGRFDVELVWPPAPPPLQVYRDTAAIADWTGDGLADYLVEMWELAWPFDIFRGMRLLADDGAGRYTDLGPAADPFSFIDAPSGHLNLAFDIDADGDLDLLDSHGVGTQSGGFWENDGSGYFTGFVPLFPGLPVAVADVDLDGDPDVVTTDIFGSDVNLERNNGIAGFQTEVLSPGGFGQAQSSFTLSDLNADGFPELIFGRAGPSSVVVFTNAAGVFTDELVLDAPSNSTSGAPMTAHIAVQDLDGDGNLDLLTVPGTGTWGDNDLALVYRGSGGMAFEPYRPYIGVASVGLADIDGDGDADGFGAATLLARRFDGPDAGSIRQYGLGAAGSGDVHPILGASGPVQVGSATASLRIRRGLGGSVALLAVGTQEANLVDQPFVGHTLLLEGLVTLLSLPLSGAPGIAAAGEATIPLTVGPGFAGLRFFHQVFVIDPAAPGSVSGTNGLEVLYGGS